MWDQGLLHYLPHRNLDGERDQTLPSNPWVSARIARIEYRIYPGRAKEEVYASWSTIIGAIGKMHILYNLFVLLTWNTSRFCAGRFGYRGNSQWSSLQLFTSLLKQTQMQNSRKCILYLDTAFIITRDFNKADLRRIAPKFFQHISCNTCGKRTLGHCYSPFQDAYKSLPRPPLGKSDHSSVLLLHAYR